MKENLLDKLAARLGKSDGSVAPTDLKFAELSDVDWDKISAAHTSNHASQHYSSP